MAKLLFALVICFYIGGTKAVAELKGRLLTPQEGCGFTKVAHKRIVGGTTAESGAWPWMARIIYKNEKGFFCNCGGSLITTRHVLTAAHCYRPDLALVRVGDQDHEDIPIVHVEKHAAYNISGDAKNDIMILYLKHDVHITDRIRPICLPTDKNWQTDSVVGKNPFIAGFGITEDGKPATALQQAQIPVLDNSVCKNAYKKIKRLVTPNQFDYTIICAGHMSGGIDTCKGDSGGPLMLPVEVDGQFPFYQIGLVSYGVGCGRPGIPGAYTKVAHFVDWIQAKLNIKP